MKMNGLRMYAVKGGHPISERKELHDRPHMQHKANNVDILENKCPREYIIACRKEIK